MRCKGDEAPPEQWSDLEGVEASCREGLSSVFVDGKIDLGAPNGASWVRVLRDLFACHVHVDWRVASMKTLPKHAPQTLSHLPPPLPDGTADVDIWRHKHTFGSLYWRRGPSYIQIKDKRNGFVQIITLDDVPSLDVFNACITGMPVHESGSAERSLPLKQLQDLGVVLKLNDCFVALPFRMKHWPVPVTSV